MKTSRVVVEKLGGRAFYYLERSNFFFPSVKNCSVITEQFYNLKSYLVISNFIIITYILLEAPLCRLNGCRFASY